jgi:leucyl aminopeptidase
VTTLSLTSTPAAAAKVDAVVIGVAQGPRGLVLVPGGDSVATALGKSLLPALAGLGATGGRRRSPGWPRSVRPPLRCWWPSAWVPCRQGSVVRRRAAAPGDRCGGAGARRLAAGRRHARRWGHGDGCRRRRAGPRRAEGALLGAYSFDRYRTTAGDSTRVPRREPVRDLLLVVPDAKDKAARAAVTRAEVVARAVRLARDLVNTPPSDLHPAELAEIARTHASAVGVDVEVLDVKALTKGGFGGILGVGQGSVNGPRMVHLSYRGANGSAAPKVALCGKGITFDSGGLSLKPAASMEDMKSDMGGAAAVIAAVAAVAELRLPVDVEAWVPMAENMPSGTAIRPSDVLTFRNGMTVEVNNTDAEGRLVLGDAIARACEDGPDIVIDVATLTGAQLVALGSRTTGRDGQRRRAAQLGRRRRHARG